MTVTVDDRHLRDRGVVPGRACRRDVDAATTGSRRLHRRGHRQGHATSARGVWTVELQAQQHRRTAPGIAISSVGADVAGHRPPAARPRSATPAAACSRSAPTSPPTNQIRVSIDDMRITSGTNGDVHRRWRTSTSPTPTQQRDRRQRSIDDAIAAVSRAAWSSSVPTRTGSSRRSPTCRSPRENLSASESRDP